MPICRREQQATKRLVLHRRGLRKKNDQDGGAYGFLSTMPGAFSECLKAERTITFMRISPSGNMLRLRLKTEMYLKGEIVKGDDIRVSVDVVNLPDDAGDHEYGSLSVGEQAETYTAAAATRKTLRFEKINA